MSKVDFTFNGQWTTKFGSDIKGFPDQTSGNSCGIFILMYALCMSTDLPFLFTEKEMAQIRKWWCVSLMERHGQRFAYWTNEAKVLLQGSLQPIYRLPKSRCHILQLPFQRIIFGLPVETRRNLD
ncbi:hypothetical protein OJAV_G00235380 [Oryzias javanicus]|uniref:Ubiquitin-like protease family profile domain-containing protein n=1 Tax=Oryzias javanicus TaxID=123683 RepID=A0A3S2MBK8_ORYJA|nr:hypothetical protein OJAV_G00235380 [Oryzias javanicus]